MSIKLIWGFGGIYERYFKIYKHGFNKRGKSKNKWIIGDYFKDIEWVGFLEEYRVDFGIF
jgi:hypothetical protein